MHRQRCTEGDVQASWARGAQRKDSATPAALLNLDRYWTEFFGLELRKARWIGNIQENEGDAFPGERLKPQSGGFVVVSRRDCHC